MRVEKRLPAGEVVVDSPELGGESFTVARNSAESFTDLGLWECAVCCEVEEVFFLRLELCELAQHLFAEQALRCFAVGESCLDALSDCGDELCAELDGLVVLLDSGFNSFRVGVGRIAEVVLCAAAEEVPVGASLSAGGSHDDHAPVGLVLEPAAPAPDCPFEVVVVAASAFAGVAASVHELLYTVEGPFVDERLVATFEVLALIANFAEVVPVPEHLLHLRGGNGPGGASESWPCPQASIGEFLDDVVDGVVPVGIELERELHERGAFGVHGDRVDLSSVDVVGDIEVAERRFAERATVLGLLAHLVGDIRAIFPGAVLIECGEDAVHELPDGGRVDGFGCGDEFDAALLKVGHDYGVVDAVASEPRQLVDDDVIDILLPADAFQHLLKRHALGHLGCGATRLDVLRCNGEAELFRLALAGDALCGDGDALRVVVRVDLPLGGDAEIDDGAGSRRDGVGRAVGAHDAEVVRFGVFGSDGPQGGWLG
nr:hypothetical protein [Rathayibacter sp. AY1C6]